MGPRPSSTLQVEDHFARISDSEKRRAFRNLVVADRSGHSVLAVWYVAAYWFEVRMHLIDR